MEEYDIHGFCPMGCGRTLFIDAEHRVRCSNDFCTDPLAVHDILADPETEHVVQLTDSSFTIVHPLRERRDDEMMVKCTVHDAFSALGGPPAPPGRYRVLPVPNDHDPTSQSFRSPMTGEELVGYKLELIGLDPE